MAEYRRAVDEAHRAIGRYIVEFSHLVYCMRCMIADRFGRDATADADFEDVVKLADLVLGEAGAQHIANVLFGMCRASTELDAAEQRVASALRESVNRVIEQATTSLMVTGG